MPRSAPESAPQSASESLPSRHSTPDQRRQMLIAGVRTASAARHYLLGGTTKRDLEQLLPDLRVVKQLELQRSMGEAAPATIFVVEMTPEAAEGVRERLARDPAARTVVFEEDAYVRLGAALNRVEAADTIAATWLPTSATFHVIGKNDEPIEDAEVSLFGSFGAARGVTGSDGEVRLTLLAAESRPTLTALHVRPKADYWSYWCSRPELDLQQPTTVQLAPLDQAFPQFPNQPLIGWGLKAMRLDTLPPDQFDGRGVTVGMLDSGCANRHRNLRKVVDGFDVTTESPTNWTSDELNHGTHCAGIIVGGGADSGVRGVAPGARLFPIKVLPHGRFSNVLAGLEQCIRRGVDIILFNVGAAQRSVLLERRIAEATRNGIACIAAAGDTAEAVQFPANLPYVLAVSAVGWRAAFPSDSQHLQSVPAGGGTQDGYFAATFASRGVQVDVSGPGVAVVSSVPPDRFAAADGTAVAAAHVAGLAALVLAHHPDFQSGAAFAYRDARRVDRLFSILKSSGQAFRMGDADRTGYGLPDAPRALNATSVLRTSSAPDDTALLQIGRNLVDIAKLSLPLAAEATPDSMVEALRRAGLGFEAEGSRHPVSQDVNAHLTATIGLVGLGDTRKSAGAASQQLADALARAGLTSG